MRFAVGAGLVLLVGCNRIFGISETRLWDAPADVIEDVPHVSLTWQVAAATTGGLPAPLAYPAIDPSRAPAVRIATMDGAFQAAEYRSADGWILIPREYEHTMWRLEYVLPDPDPLRGAPHEVQWAPDEKQGYLTIPIVGRIQPEPRPLQSSYHIITSPAATLASPSVFTTGLWSASQQVSNLGGGVVDYDFSRTTWLGFEGQLKWGLGDRAVLVDFVTDTASGCRIAAGTGAFPETAVDLRSGGPTSATVAWIPTRQPVMSNGVPFDVLTRMFVALGSRHSAVSTKSYRMLGVAPSIVFPGLTRARSGDPLLPLPAMLTLLQCPYATPLPDTAQPTALGGYPFILHVQLVSSRTVTLVRDGGATLTVTLDSGLETVLVSSNAGVETGSKFQTAFPSAIATAVKLTTPVGVLDLAGDVDQLPAGGPDGSYQLDFATDASADLRADYHDVILHRIANGALVPARVYTVTQPRVRIDGSVLAGDTDYVFEIRTYKGHPQASHGDFRPVDYPYGAAIVFTRTFRTASRQRPAIVRISDDPVR